MTHAWCRDPSRDAAVRAAEDGRDRPLPTLEECIETAFSAGVRDSFRKVEEAWAMIPKSVSASSPVGQENKGDGMRTERVTLEVVHGAIASINDQRWWDNRLWIEPQKGESVRVVEVPVGSVDDRAYADRMGCDEERDFANRIIDQRDAAIRERDAAVAESERRLRLCETMKRDGDSARFHAAVAQARVAELEGCSWVPKAERDAAIRERDEIRQSWLRSEESGTRLLAQRNAALDAADGLRKRVAELEQSIMLCSGSCGFAGRSTQAASGGGEQPRGWLTGEERRFVHWWAYEDREPTDKELDAFKIAAKALLARSSPPEVEHPDCHFDQFSGCSAVHAWNICAADFRKALAAAGVAVKEVQ
jgi:hypothetical protein